MTLPHRLITAMCNKLCGFYIFYSRSASSVMPTRLPKHIF